MQRSGYSWKLLRSILFLLILFSCTKKKERSISFYHWKTKMDVSEAEGNYLDSLTTDKLYFRFFDVHWDHATSTTYPLSPLEWNHFDLGREVELVPVVYVTNVSLKHTEYDTGIDTLATNIAKKIESIAAQIDTVRFKMNELQLDCDWSLETQAKYFRLVELLKKRLPAFRQFSATIRLHQIKYFTTTGVPPVDRGVLMFYNMGELTDPDEENSILNLKTAKKYLQNFKAYPLELDVALPLFSWGVQFRKKRVVQLINDVSLSELRSDKRYQELDGYKFKVLESNYLRGQYVYKNDIIRVEKVEVEQLQKSMKLLKKSFGQKHFNLVFYHLDDYIIQEYESKILQKLAE